MINAQELRIGNAVDKGTIINLLESGVHIGYGKCYSYSEINPIPLSPEVLERCGFEIDGIQSSKNQVVLIYEYGYFRHWYNKSVDGFINIRSLHQLQNLYYALTGEELTY